MFNRKLKRQNNELKESNEKLHSALQESLNQEEFYLTQIKILKEEIERLQKMIPTNFRTI